MVNLNVGYVRPNRALAQLTKELRAKYGNPVRTYEFITGYKSATNLSGHNADAYGVVHSVDIFVGPGNLTTQQGTDVAEDLRREGIRGAIPGHPDRLAYIIHGHQIAGDHTGWVWVPYAGIDPHTDHIHVSSVFDYYWGDPVPGNPADYDSAATWGLGALKPQGDKPTPIPQEDELTMSAAKEVIDYVGKMLWHGFTSGGKNYPGIGKITIENQRRINGVAGEIAAQRSLLEQLAKGQGVTIDYAKVEAAAAAGVAKAIADGVDLDATVTIKKESL